MLSELAPPLTPPGAVVDALRRDGFAVVGSSWVAELTTAPLSAWTSLARDWDDLPVDPHLKDGGHYRRRRHASFVVEGARCSPVPHRAHFQSPEYNALHGGMLRWFEPMHAAVTEAALWRGLLVGLGEVCSAVAAAERWYVEAHQFRIDTGEGIGRPTPEGAHRDGVDFVALLLVARHCIRGGETRVFDAHGQGGLRFTLSEPWSVLLLDDARKIHETTPIQPAAPAAPTEGHRDTLVLTYRRGSFQAP